MESSDWVCMAPYLLLLVCLLPTTQVERVDRDFDLVMLAERMEESLVLMSHLLCWPLEEVLVLKYNARNQEVLSVMLLAVLCSHTV